MREVVIVEALRSPIGKFGGTLSSLSAVDLAVQTTEKLLEKAKVKPEIIEEVIIGNVLSAGKGQNIARQVAVKSGIPVGTPAFTVSNVCGSGMRAVISATQAILTGDRDVILTGGTESMSQAAFVSSDTRWGARLGDSKLIDTILSDGLTDAFSGIHMGITAENLAERFNISREAQDSFALKSQIKAVKAIKENKFESQIAPIKVSLRGKESQIISVDEAPRDGLDLEKLSHLKPVFKNDGTVTAGNSSGINDGAAMLILMSKEKAESLGIKYKATIKSYAFEGTEPNYMGCGPIASTQKALFKGNLTIDDIDLVESNEAFAAQALTVSNGLKLEEQKTNIYGGAIALGHPIGASGARILTTLLYALEDCQKDLGLATLCVGGGMGVSIIIQREDI